MPPSSANRIAAAKTAASTHILMVAAQSGDEAALAKARKDVQQIMRMSDADVLALVSEEGEGDEPEPPLQHRRHGDFVSYLRDDEDGDEEEPGSRPPLRIPAGQRIGKRWGGQWIPAKALCRFLARLWTDLTEAGEPPDDEEIDSATADLEAWGWTLDVDEEGTWHAAPVEDAQSQPQPHWRMKVGEPLHYRRVKKGSSKAFREKETSKGKKYWIDAAQAHREDAHGPGVSPKRAKALTRNATRATRKVEHGALTQRITKAIESHGVPKKLTGAEKTRTAQSWKALQRFHGAGALAKVEEMVEDVEEAIAKSSGLQKHKLAHDLARLHHMAGLAGDPDRAAEEAKSKRTRAQEERAKRPPRAAKPKVEPALAPEAKKPAAAPETAPLASTKQTPHEAIAAAKEILRQSPFRRRVGMYEDVKAPIEKHLAELQNIDTLLDKGRDTRLIDQFGINSNEWLRQFLVQFNDWRRNDSVRGKLDDARRMHSQRDETVGMLIPGLRKMANAGHKLESGDGERFDPAALADFYEKAIIPVMDAVLASAQPVPKPAAPLPSAGVLAEASAAMHGSEEVLPAHVDDAQNALAVLRGEHVPADEQERIKLANVLEAAGVPVPEALEESKPPAEKQPHEMTGAEWSRHRIEQVRKDPTWQPFAAMIDAAWKVGQKTGGDSANRVLSRKQIENLLGKHPTGETINSVDRGMFKSSYTGLDVGISKVGENQYLITKIEPGGPNATHRRLVEKAIAAGEPLPPEVIADYPELLFTGIDAHGHKWVNGHQAKRDQEEQIGAPAEAPAAPEPPLAGQQGEEPVASEPPPDATPRQASEATDAEQQKDYQFARESAVPNAGEDLKGSARHKVGAWRGLAQAEKDGTAAELVTRVNLLKNEPPELTGAAESGNALSALAMQLAIQKYPPGPTEGDVKRYGNETELLALSRKWYYDGYRHARETAERLAQMESDPQKALQAFHLAVRTRYQALRAGTGEFAFPEALSGIDKGKLLGFRHAASNPYVRFINTNSPSSYTAGKLGTISQLGDFVKRIREAYPETTPETTEKVKGHVLDILDGDSFNKTFGTKTGGKERFDPATAYTSSATREGGPKLNFATVGQGTEYILNDLGIRGLQWGNSVTDSEREHHLKLAAESLTDLADALGLDHRDVSINSKLGLAIGARGHGSALAHYEPGTKVINLTRKSGVGSLAHEWGHFLDNQMGGGQPEKFGSERMGWHGNTSPADTAFAKLRQAIQPMHRRIGQWVYSQGKKFSPAQRQYWLSTREVFARTFERYVQLKLGDMGRRNTYLTGVEKHDLWPTDEEVRAVMPALDAVMDAFRQNKARYLRAGQPLRYRRFLAAARRATDPHTRRSLLTQAREMGWRGSPLGRAQPLDAGILTPAGMVLMGHVGIGTEVIAGDGTATLVKAVFPQGEKEIYHLTLDNGASTQCCLDHLWSTDHGVVSLGVIMQSPEAYQIPVLATTGASWQWHKVSVITLVGMKEAQCIQVAHPEHLYVTNDRMITHNSPGSAARFAKEDKQHHMHDEASGRFTGKGGGGSKAAPDEDDDAGDEDEDQRESDEDTRERLIAEWDGSITSRYVEEERGYPDDITFWNFYDSEGNHFPQKVSLRHGMFSVDPDDPDPNTSRAAVDVWRWESSQEGAGTLERGEWTADEDEAREGGEEYARENEMEEPEEEEDDDSDVDDDDDDDSEGSTGSVTVRGNRRKVEEAWEALFATVDQEVPDMDDAGVLVGVANIPALKGAKITVSQEDGDIEVEVSHPKIKSCTRTLSTDNSGNLVCSNDIFVIKKNYRDEGIGADVFSAQVAEMAAAGVTAIETYAARNDSTDPDEAMNGYYTWVRFGYNMSVSKIQKVKPEVGRKLAAEFPDAKSILDVMATARGREWWKKYGCGLAEARFDLAEGSRSRRVLDAYREERKKQ